jgi:hypothetical protein
MFETKTKFMEDKAEDPAVTHVWRKYHSPYPPTVKIPP